jgi:hypothetical protein
VEDARLLLGGGVGDEAQVQDDDPPLRRDQHVRGLDVAVHLARLVQRVQAVGELAQRGAQPRDVAHARRLTQSRLGRARRRVAHRGRAGERVALLRLPPRPHVVDEVRAVDQLHGEEPAAVLLGEIAEVHEVGVVQVVLRAELVLEPEQVLAADPAHRLQREPPAALAVLDLVDDAHPALAEAAHDLEAGRAAELVDVREHRHALLGVGPPTPRL